MSNVLDVVASRRPAFVVGQGTGPFAVDQSELADLAQHVPLDVPLTTSLAHFGHTMGASSLLSVALAALAWTERRSIASLDMDVSTASDNRPLLRGPQARGNVLVSCRAMSGACAAAVIGAPGSPTAGGAAKPCETGPKVDKMMAQVQPSDLMHPTLRQIADEACRNRPKVPPDLLVVKLDAPLTPSARSIIGGRILPSAVLELTPGFVSQLVARCWSLESGAVCLVGGPDTDAGTRELIRGCERSGLSVSVMWLRGGGDDRTIEWEA
jgi:hypothetical protein